MAKERTRFLISPIGKDGSDTRQLADDLMELIVAPALKLFNFRVIRADKIPRPSVITADIIQLVQSSDLCIIDLTGSNPNVFYECGRRHETGKPFIQLIKKDESLPFDVAGIRTIQYDVSSARSVHDSVIQIQNYVSEMLNSGFETTASGESLTSIASALDRIERKVNQLSMSPIAVSEIIKDSPNDDEFLKHLEYRANPRRAFIEAYSEGDWKTAYSLLPELRTQLGKTGEVLVSAAIFCRAGDEAAASIVEEILLGPDEELKPESLLAGIASLGTFYELHDREDEGIATIGSIFERECDNLNPEAQASLNNEMQKLLYAAGRSEDALPYAERALQLQPNEHAYMYNLSLIYDNIGRTESAVDLIDQLLAAKRNTPGAAPSIVHLMHAAVVYAKIGRQKDAKQIYKELERLAPARARELVGYVEVLRLIVESG